MNMAIIGDESCWRETWLRTKFENDAWILSLWYDSSAIRSCESGKHRPGGVG